MHIVLQKDSKAVENIKERAEELLNEERQLLMETYKSDRDITLLRDQVEWDTRAEYKYNNIRANEGR